MTSQELIRKIESLFAERGASEYHGESVSQQEHALQSAMLAEAEGAEAALIAAALLHDVGHLLHGHGEGAAERGIDDAHEELGQRFLRKHFPGSVTEPIRLHVAAKRYLCAAEPGYLASLSPASVQSLALQGGPMSPSDAEAFLMLPYGEAAARLRRWDDRAKIPGLPTPPLSHYRTYLDQVLSHGT
jgi:phosphonate degradation associated HDIG domain protein